MLFRSEKNTSAFLFKRKKTKEKVTFVLQIYYNIQILKQIIVLIDENALTEYTVYVKIREATGF